MFRILTLVVAVALVIGTGFVHGIRTFRWGTPEAVTAAAERLSRIPREVGTWVSTDLPLDQRNLEVGEIMGYVHREYVNQAATDQRVSILVICGRTGPISVHPPDVCYAGAGYRMGDKTPLNVDGPPASQVWTARFSKPGPEPDPLRLFWAWGTGSTWSAPVDARQGFDDTPYLYKLYVVRRMGKEDESVKDDPGLDLLNLLVPQLHEALSPDP